MRCGDDQNCLNGSRTALNDYLKNQPDPRFSLTGMVTDEAGNPMSGVVLNLTGSQSLTTETDAAGNFQFLSLPTSGSYTVSGSKPHYTVNSQTFVNPAHDVNASLVARFNLPEIVKIEESENALVLDSVAFVKGPISVFERLGFSRDGITRAVFFVKYLEEFNDPSHVLMIAEESAGEKFPLQIESIADVPQGDPLKQINVKLRTELKGKCVNLTLSDGELTSHAAQLCVAQD